MPLKCLGESQEAGSALPPALARRLRAEQRGTRAADKTNFVSVCLSSGRARCGGINQPATERPARPSFTKGSSRPNQYSPLNKKRVVC